MDWFLATVFGNFHTSTNELGCTQFTFVPETGGCVLNEGCPTLDIEGCPSCISGDVQCPVELCDVQGFCNGVIIGIYPAQPNAFYCAEHCQNTAFCKAWSFDASDGFCVTLESCESLDDSCTTCTSGVQSCDMIDNEDLSE